MTHCTVVSNNPPIFKELSFGAPIFSAPAFALPARGEGSYSCSHSVLIDSLVISHFGLDRPSSMFYAQTSMDQRTFLKSSEVARVLGISRRTLALWVKEGRILEPAKSPAGYFIWSETDLQ